jgi:hypothetical protein
VLYSVASKEYIDDGYIPHRASYDAWRKQLTPAEYDAIFDELDRRVSKGDVHTSSWIPGANWMGTVFQPIYDKACHYDEEAAAKFYGLILWHVMLERDELCQDKSDNGFLGRHHL